jgi:hypothetical protein
MQFPSRECLLGLNVICETCHRCSFPDKFSEKACYSDRAYEKWSKKNCCVNAQGKKVLCSDLLPASHLPKTAILTETSLHL